MLPTAALAIQRDLTLVVEGALAALELLDQLQSVSIHCIPRLRLDARLYEPPPARLRGHPGRPRIKGARLPALQTRLADRKTRWQTATVPNWYGNAGRRIQLCSGTAIWYHGGLPPISIRWVLIRDPQASFDPLALLSTDPSAQPLDIIADYVCRWQLEVTFEQARAHPGLETQRQWPDKAIARSTPLLLGLFLAGDPAVVLFPSTKTPAHPLRQLVSKVRPDFLRCPCRCQAPFLASCRFIHLPCWHPQAENPSIATGVVL